MEFHLILSYGMSVAIWDYQLPDTSEHTHSLTLAIQAGTRFTYPGSMEGWVDLGGRLHTEVI